LNRKSCFLPVFLKHKHNKNKGKSTVRTNTEPTATRGFPKRIESTLQFNISTDHTSMLFNSYGSISALTLPLVRKKHGMFILSGSQRWHFNKKTWMIRQNYCFTTEKNESQWHDYTLVARS